MFEKDAEEYADGKGHEHYNYLFEKHAGNPADFARLCFQDGAEFGYNKAFVEADKNLKAIVTDFNKANEWHYPSKGEYPKCDEKTQLMFYVNCYYKLGDETVTIKRIVLGYYKKAFLRDDEKVFVEKSRGYEGEHLPQAVIAWKEIVPPKEGE